MWSSTKFVLKIAIQPGKFIRQQAGKEIAYSATRAFRKMKNYQKILRLFIHNKA